VARLLAAANLVPPIRDLEKMKAISADKKAAEEEDDA
jgi:hypothetical protein